MKPDFFNNIDDELPKPANFNKENDSFNNQNTQTTNQESNLDEQSLGNSVFGFEKNEEINSMENVNNNQELFESANQEVVKEDVTNQEQVINTPEINVSQPIPNKNKKGLVMIILAIVVTIGVGYGVYKGLTYFTNKKPINSNNNLNNQDIVVDPIKDEEVYSEKIITDNINQVLLFSNGSESIYLYINAEQEVYVMIGNLGITVDENSEGYLVSNFENITAKSFYQSAGCNLNERLTYLLMEDGSLYYFDLNKGYAELYTSLKNALIGQKVSVEAKNVVLNSPIKAFTSIVDGRTECKTIGVYVLTNSSKPEIRKIEHKSNDLISISERYKGHVHYLGNNKIDYLVYADKTIGDLTNKLLVDSNGQNHKFDKVIYGQGNIEELKSFYAFIGTDNKLYYNNEGNLLDLKTNNKIVREIVAADKLSADGSINYKTVVINYTDNTTETLTSLENDLNIVDIQELIDTPIN